MKNKLLISALVCLTFFNVKLSHSQLASVWTQKSNIDTSNGRNLTWQTLFVVNNMAYVGFGGANYNEVWQYDPSTNIWTQKSSFPGPARSRFVSFAIGNKGYMGTGSESFTGTLLNDFWEYDPFNDSWTQKNNFSGVGRFAAVGFAIGSKGYLGTGYYSSSPYLLSDFWEYNPSNDSWTQKATFGGTARNYAVAFSIGNKGYIGPGWDGTYNKDFWEYDPTNNSWTKKTDFGGAGRRYATGFNIGSKGYIGLGFGVNGNIKYNDFWEYDQSNNNWTQKADFGGTARYLAMGFAVNGKGYIGSGEDTVAHRLNDFWEYGIPNVSAFPYITISAGSINQNQSLVIQGNSFTTNNKANLIVSGPNSFQNTFTTNTTTTGKFTCNFPTNNNMPIGQYTISVVDSATGIYAAVKSFVLNNNVNNYTKLVVLSPETNDTLFLNDTSQISWTDKLVLGSGYTVNGAKRNYKYTLEYSSNNGAAWQTLTSLQGWDYINSIKTFHVPVSFNTTSNNYLVRVTDFYKSTNADSSGLFKVITPVITASNIKAELYWDFSYSNQNNALYGVAADGTARIYLVVSKINAGIGASISNVSVQISDAWNNSTSTLGKVMASTQVSSYSIEANASNSLNATQNTAAFSRFWFWYVAPDDFTGNNSSDANSAYRYVTAHFTINYSNSTSETIDKQVKIVRPPLCFVHGLASDPSAWDNFRHNALGYELDFLNDSRFYTKRAIQLDAKASFNVNAQYLTLGFNNQNSFIFQNSLQGIIKDLRNQGYASNRCDYIGHSMGGSILRYTLDHYGNHFYRTGSASNLDYKNYGRGYVNKTITINTPHNSSPWADILQRYTPDLTVAMRVALGIDYGSFPNSLPFSFIQMDNMNSLIPNFTVVDAVRDLQIDENQGGVNFGTTNLKTHLIGSDFFPGVQNAANNMIPQGVINFVDQAAEEVDFLNKFLDLTIAEEQDQQLVSDLVEITSDYSNPVQTALQYVERMADLYNTACFIPESDLVVGVSSQLADYPRTAPNVSVFDNYIGHAFIRPVLNDVDAGTRVNDLLNAQISSNQFNIITATSNKSERPSLNELLGERSTTTVLSYRDTTKLKILNPISNTQLKTDSMLSIKVMLSDTTYLISYKVSFQNKTYKLSKREGITDLAIQVNSNLLDTNYIFAEAFFKRPDTSFFFFDTVKVNVTTTSSLVGFSAKQKIIYLNINQTKTPDYVSYYNGFATAVSNFSQFISANVANSGIVSFNPFRKSFTGITTGETSAIVSYKGLNDTIYFVVGENPLDSLISDTVLTNIEGPTSVSKQPRLLCYPNPSNQNMIIDFDVTNSGDVSIKVYDLLGHEQLTIFEGKSETGSYRTTLDGSKLSNGIYFCELKNENQRAISRIVFLR